MSSSNGNNGGVADDAAVASVAVRHNPSIFAKQLICMVGLPARGKTYISRKLARYLTWIGVRCRVFNVGEYRRRATSESASHTFFEATNEAAMALRQEVAERALGDALGFLGSDGGGDVAIFDATNVTLARRQLLRERSAAAGYLCLFIESVCDDEDIVAANVAEVKVHGPDYKGVASAEEAAADFQLRVEHYQEQYVPMSEERESHLSYIKVINAGERLVINRHCGNLQSKVGYWLMNLHITPRTIWLTRHGESEMNVAGRIGGNSGLSPRGREYARRLGDHINGLGIPHLRVWTSEMRRTVETAAHVRGMAPERWKALNELDAGACEELTYEEIRDRFPADYAAREADKLSFRYSGGESYRDLIARLEPAIMELEREGDMLVVGHQAVLRCILCYFMDKPLGELPYVEVPLHTLIKIQPVASGCDIETIPLGVEAVNTHRPRAAAADAVANGK